MSGDPNRNQNPPLAKPKKKRNLPGNPDLEAEIISLSPTTLTAPNRFICEICNRGFQREQNLQLHRRGHNLPWKLRQHPPGGPPARNRAYICPEPSCPNHDPARALGDLTGIKKHFWRKHGEKKWKCERCGKRYAVQSDHRAHMKTCGTREYRCDCGTVFCRRDSFVTHRAFCDALTREGEGDEMGARVVAAGMSATALLKRAAEMGLMRSTVGGEVGAEKRDFLGVEFVGGGSLYGDGNYGELVID